MKADPGLAVRRIEDATDLIGESLGQTSSDLLISANHNCDVDDRHEA